MAENLPANRDKNLPTKKSGEDIDKPTFDIVFQMGVLRMAIVEDYFCTQMVKYLANDKDLDEYSIFDSLELQEIFKIINESVTEFKSRPTEGQIRQKISEKPDDERQNLNDAIDQVLSTDTHNDEFYRKYLSTYIQQVKMAKGFKKTKKIWKERPNDAPEYMQLIIDDIRRVSFEKEDIISMDDLPQLISDGITQNTLKIKTGIKQLDEDLVGGLPRENLTVVLAGTNVGKSLFCISLACNALRAVNEQGQDCGYKILHVNLEGMRDEALKRYAANLAQINYGDLIRGTFDPEAKKRLDDITVRYGSNRLMIRNMLGFGATIEDLVAFCREIYKDYKFDMLVVDYGQLLETKQKTEGHRFTMSKVFRGLDSISKEFSAVVITPAQATRGAQTKQNEKSAFAKQDDRAPILRSEDISEAFEIARVSGVILTLNVTEEEGKKSRLRLFLEKQRQGAKNKIYGLITNYSQCNLATGKEYDPFETVIQGEVVINNNTQADSAKKTIRGGMTGTITPTNLPKPPPKEGSQTEDSKELSKGTSYDLVEVPQESTEPEMSETELALDRMCEEFLATKQEFLNLKDAYDKIRNQDDADSTTLDNYLNNLTLLQNSMKNKQSEIRMMLPQVHSQANKEFLINTKKSYTDLKRSSPTSKDLPIYERMIKHLEIGLGENKIPVSRDSAF